MTDWERLEKIKSRAWKDKGIYAMGDYSQREGYIYTLSDYDYEWLVKQAERVEELEKEKDEWKDTAQSYYMTNQELREQNKRYRKAINNIIEKVMLFGTNEEVYEAIQDAIKALEGME